MKSWEYSKNIIAFFESYPQVSQISFSFFTTVISNRYQTYTELHSNYDNPELKSDPYEISEEIVSLITSNGLEHVSVDLLTNLEYYKTPRHQYIYNEYIIPMIQSISSHTTIDEVLLKDIDLFSLRGLFDHTNRKLISEMINTVIYV